MQTAFLSLIVFPVYCVLATVARAQCGTEVQGPVSGTWTSAGSPYCVIEDVVATDLTIEAGVLVRFEPGTSLRVEGSLMALGAPAAPIRFDAASEGETWAGLELFAASGSTLNHCSIQNATGSGLRVLRGTTVLNACEISSNRSGTFGGGIFASLPLGDLSLTDCTLRANSALEGGGGMSAQLAEGALSLTRCRFLSNRSNPDTAQSDGLGGGLAAFAAAGIEITDSLFERNVAQGFCDFCFCSTLSQGGGLYVEGCALTLTRCVFRGNEARARDDISLCSGEFATSEGGGVYFAGAGLPLLAENCVFVGNVSRAEANGYNAFGGGLTVRNAVLDMRNCTIARNELIGGGIGLGGGAGIQSGPGSTGSIDSTLIWGNIAPVGSGTGLITVTVDYSLTPSPTPGILNLSTDPLFRGAGTSACAVEIGPDSPCIDAGNPAASRQDLAFPPSLGTTRNDIGALGGPAAASWSAWTLSAIELAVDPSPNPCPTTPSEAIFRVHGGMQGQPVGIFLEAIHGIPLGRNPAQLVPFGFFCTTGEAEFAVTTPGNVCKFAGALTFRAYTLDATGAIVGSNSVVW